MPDSGVIPIDNSLGFSTIRVALGDATYLLRTRYNARMDRWILDVADSNANLLVAGIPILGEWPTLTRFQGIIAGLPKGMLASIDMTGSHRDPQENTFGTDCPLFYLEP